MQSKNKLRFEKSPYLLQHEDNPVNWYPWGEEAFEKAKEEDKPLFLSIGYSTCHWCHVMAHESFEDPDTADILNKTFINIKVDREERPDIDSVYMAVCQMLTGSGGWPLTVIMTPDKKPFFAGTYFPRESMYGRIGLKDLAAKVDDLWKNKRTDVLSSADERTNQLKGFSQTQKASVDIDREIFDRAYGNLDRTFDDTHGGFSAAPKFPIPHNLTFLLRYWKETGEKRALEMVEKTLEKMRLGGIYDHIGFGFHRYSTDERWLVPHFEKMLYDQALLITAYTEAYLAVKNDLYRKTAEEIIKYVLTDMTDSSGGFFSAEDADSEGKEGKFYVWKEKEIDEILKEDSVFFKNVFNITGRGNFTIEPGSAPEGTNIVHKSLTDSELASQLNMNKEEFSEKIETCRQKLFNKRAQRVHPYKDDKILTDWNGMMISALSAAYRTFGKKEYYNAAKKSADFIINNLYKDNHLLHRWRSGEAAIDAHLDDYAFFTLALIDLYQAGFEVQYLKFAAELTEEMTANFEDKEIGGFFFGRENNKDLIVRKKELYDGAQPSGNSTALLALNKLFSITGGKKYRETSDRCIKAFSSEISRMPMGYTQFLNALYFTFGQSQELILISENESEELKKMISLINENFHPNLTVTVVTKKSEKEGIYEISPFLKDYQGVENKVTAYLCQNFKCSMAVFTRSDLEKLIFG